MFWERKDVHSKSYFMSYQEKPPKKKTKEKKTDTKRLKFRFIVKTMLQFYMNQKFPVFQNKKCSVVKNRVKEVIVHGTYMI